MLFRSWGGMWAAAARLCGMESMARWLRSPRGRGTWTLGIGLTLYDLLAAGSDWPRHRTVRAGGLGMPRIDAASFPWACTYADGQAVAAERLAVEMLVDAREIAAAQGAAFAVHTRSHARLEADGRLSVNAEVQDALTVLRPAAIVNATGAWVDQTCRDLLPGASTRLIGGTKGSHLVVDSPSLRDALGDGGIYAEADDGRAVFVLPFGRRLVLVGTTDIPYDGDPAAARADDAEIDYLLAAAARLFPNVSLGRGAVQQHYSGVRPLPAVDPSRRGSPGAITRRHGVVRHPGAPVPLWSIIGGKLTTCRHLAETVAADVLGAVGVPVRGTSRDRPLPGAWAAGGAGVPPAELLRDTAAAMAAAGVPTRDAEEAAVRLVDIFGTRAVAACREAAPAGWRGSPMIADIGLPSAAVWFAVRHEWARSLADIVERRLMLVFDPRLSRRSLDAIADALVSCGTLAAHQRQTAVDGYAARLRDHFGKQLFIPQENAP